jgi:hypothetical protein
LLCIHCSRVFFIVVYCVCVLFECVVTLCNVLLVGCVLLLNYCHRATTQLQLNK